MKGGWVQVQLSEFVLIEGGMVVLEWLIREKN